MSKTLWEINTEIMECFDAETGEIFDVEKLESLHLEREQKIENIALYVKNLTSEAAAIRAEEKALAERRKAKENKAESLKQYLSFALDGAKFETPKVNVSFNKSSGVKVTDKEDLIHWLEFSGLDDCIRYKTPEPDLNKVKALLKQGEKVEGAELENRENINIK